MDAVPAQLSVVSGPDAGKSFGLVKDLVHVGTAQENEIVLTDPHLAAHQASFASRNGRFAIYVPNGPSVEIEGNLVPAERWTWLPSAAQLRFGSTTVCRFQSLAAVRNGGVPGANTATVTIPDGTRPQPPPLERRTESVAEDGEGARAAGAARRRKPIPKKSGVARFITDQPGDPLVRLGEDGQLPVLALEDAAEAPQADRPTERNPLILYGVLACSFVLSLGLLLLEPDPPAVSQGTRAAARQRLHEFYGEDGAQLEPYQLALRRGLLQYSKGDLAGERREYRRVLQMLNAADIRDPANLHGLTGRHTGRGRASDAELRALLETLLTQ